MNSIILGLMSTKILILTALMQKKKTVFSQNIKVKLVQRMQSITLNPLLKQPALLSPSLLVMKLDLPVINFAEIYKKLAFLAL